MKFMMMEGEGAREVSVDELSGVNIRQAAAIADAIGRLIPHEGVDYCIDISRGELSLMPENEKGVEWCRFLRDSMSRNPPYVSTGDAARTDVISFISGMIPRDGVDYDSVITFKGRKSSEVSYRIMPYGEKGTFWAGYVSRLLRKYPPRSESASYMLPESPEPVVDESKVSNEMEKINEKVMH